MKSTFPLAALLCAACGTAGCGQVVTETDPEEGACPDAPLDVAFGGADSEIHIEGLSVAVDGACNLLVAGVAQGALDLGGGDLVAAQHPHGFVAKLDPDGGHLWSIGLPGVRLSGKRVIAVDGQGAVFVGGATFGDPNSVEYDHADRVTLIKIGADGEEIWRNVMPGNTPADVGFDWGFRRYVRGVALGPDGGVVIGGELVGETDFGGVTLATEPFVSDFSTDYKPDVFVASYDAGRELVFARSFGGDDYDRRVGLDTTPEGDTVLSFIHNPDSMTPDDSYGMYFMKLGPDGGTVWSTSLPDSGVVDGGPSVVATEAGGMVVGGTGFLSPGALCGCSPAFAARLGPGGDFELGAQIGDPSEGAETIAVSSVIPDGEHGILVVGGFGDTLLVHGKALAESNGALDAFEAHIEEDFDALAASSWGGAAEDLAVAIARAPNGARVIAGVEGPMFEEQGEPSAWTGGARLFLRRR